MIMAQDLDKQVVVILPIAEGRVLMQLRDLKSGIDAPGCWGFFGGSIAAGESPETAAKRELLEEVGFDATFLRWLSSEKIFDLDRIYAHAFACDLSAPLEELNLREGTDFRLVSLEDIVARKVYSEKLQRYFPTVSTYFIEKTVRKSLALWSET